MSVSTGQQNNKDLSQVPPSDSYQSLTRVHPSQRRQAGRLGWLASGWLASGSHISKKVEQERMFDLFQQRVWKVIQICQRGVGWPRAKVASKLWVEVGGWVGDWSGDGRQTVSYRWSLACLPSQNSDPPGISSLIKQYVSQCSKDDRRWHFTSQMSNAIRYSSCFVHAKCIQYAFNMNPGIREDVQQCLSGQHVE